MEIWQQVQSFLSYSVLDISLDRFVVALFILFAVFFLRQVVLRIGIRFFRTLTSRTKTDIDDRLIDVVEKPARLLLVVIGFWAALEYMRLPEDAGALATTVVRSLFAFCVFWALYRATDMLSGLLKTFTSKTKSDFDDQLVNFIARFMRVAVVALGAMVLVREWGYDIAGLVAGLGLGGLAVALAAKDTVANIFGSITILLDKPFTVGDWIETPSVEGTVEDIHIRSTRIRTFANAQVSVPNSVLANSAITNWSRMKKRRIKYTIGVTYGSKHTQIEACVKELRSMLENCPDIHPDVVFVYFNSFGENALEIFLYFFTKTTVWQEYLRAREEVNIEIMKIIEKHGMSFAFPSRSIYLENQDAASQSAFDKALNKGKGKKLE
ncbi:mechanosensitive ion channel family protein [candidate division KSB1 bacterium]